MLGSRYVCFVAAGVYRRVWRFATAHDLVAIAVAVAASGLLASESSACAAPGGFDWQVFPLDAVICAVLVAARGSCSASARTRGRRALTDHGGGS